jgi:hypothetical protein
MELTSSISLFPWLNSRVTGEPGGHATHQTAIEYISSLAFSIQGILKVIIIYLNISYLLVANC